MHICGSQGCVVHATGMIFRMAVSNMLCNSALCWLCCMPALLASTLSVQCQLTAAVLLILVVQVLPAMCQVSARNRLQRCQPQLQVRTAEAPHLDPSVYPANQGTKDRGAGIISSSSCRSREHRQPMYHQHHRCSRGRGCSCRL
jgi:hypothetical protein